MVEMVDFGKIFCINDVNKSCKLRNEPVHEILVLITPQTSQGLEEPEHSLSLTGAFAVGICNMGESFQD